MPFDEQSIEFDEAWYLSVNPGVAGAVRSGALSSGLDHYLKFGRTEGRRPIPFDRHDLDAVRPHHDTARYLNPTELTVTPALPHRVALIGSCMMEGWVADTPDHLAQLADLFVTNGTGTPPTKSAEEVSGYDFQIIQLPLRDILLDPTLARTAYGAPEDYEVALCEAEKRLEFYLQCRMGWNAEHGLLTFVSNFFVPQRNAMGVLFPRYDLRNPEYFIERLNQKLEALVRSHRNAYILDIDRISASMGRRNCQDDCVSHFSHGGLIGTPDELTARMEPVAPMAQYYDITLRKPFVSALWSEAMAMYRVVRQTDAVKLVVVDLDDTLWNGVTGDMVDIQPIIKEGWPLGFAEALLFLKKRGILLAIVSKNEESRIREIWPKIYGNTITLDDFAAIRINWRPKAENMREILEGVNLLPRSVVFIDDNPVERASMKSAFPDMRILGRHPYYLRRTMLWSPETQVAFITDESARRTGMIQAQLERETTRKSLTREDFLKSAAPKVALQRISSEDHPQFARCLELLNKTNQFNTTGKRWTSEEISRFFTVGGAIFAFEVRDTFTDYGLVGVVLVSGDEIQQWVMSCRVLGLEIETAVVAEFAGKLAISRGRIIETDANFPCRDLFAKCGFRQDGDAWTLDPGELPSIPAHVAISWQEERAD